MKCNFQFVLIIIFLFTNSCIVIPTEAEYIRTFSGDYYLKSDTTIKVLTVTEGKHYVFSHPEIGYFEGSVDSYEYLYDLGIRADLNFDSLNFFFTLYQVENQDYKILNGSARYVNFGALKDVRYEDGIYLIKK